MHKSPVAILSFIAFLGTAVIQVYMIDAYYQEKSNHFDMVYAYAVRHSIENQSSESFFYQLDMELQDFSSEILDQKHMGEHSKNDIIAHVDAFHTLIKKHDANEEIIKEYLVANSLDSTIQPTYILESISVFDILDTLTLIDREPLVDAEKERGLFIKNYEYEGNNYRLRYAYHLDFTKKRRLILQEMQGLLLGAFLTLAAVLATFLYTYLIIQKQKKLAALKDDLIDNISHEFKTPLTSISVATATIKQSAAKMSSDQLDKICDTISDQNKVLTNMIDYVIDVSLLDRNTHELKRSIVKIKSVLSNWMDTTKANLKHEGMEVSLTMHMDLEDETQCNIDLNQITKVLSNLVNNAIKYSGREPIIEIRVATDDDFLTVEVKDNGMGIAPEDQPHIFDKFYRGAARVNKKGLGLGLYITKRIIDQHDGTIEVISHPGVGTSFRIKLPKR